MRYFIILLVVIAFGCEDQKDIPADILPPKKMEHVLWDVLRADEITNLKVIKDSNINRVDTSLSLYDRAFQIHKVTAEQFKTSLDYYQAHPALLQSIIDSLQFRATQPLPPRNIKKAELL